MSRQPASSPVESYLDELLTACAGLPPGEARWLLAESEAHLYDRVEALVASGVPDFEAQERAVAQFGPVAAIVRAERDRGRLPLLVLARQVLGSAVLLGSVGAIAVGISGVLAAALQAIGGARLLVGDPSSSAMTGSACARWFQGDPHAASCAAAAVSDWSSETIWYRIAFGVLGAVVLAVGHRYLARGSGRLLPAQVRDTIAVTLFLAAGVATTALGIDAIATASGHGSGKWLSAAPVALGAAALYGLRLSRALRRQPAARAA
jgi:hypothetical protein